MTPHYLDSREALNELEQRLAELSHLRQYLVYLSEKVSRGESISSEIKTAIGIFDFHDEKLDEQFLKVFKTVITNYPQN